MIATRNSLRSGIFGSRNARVLPELCQSIMRGRSGVSGEVRARARGRAPMTRTSLVGTARAKLRGELMKRAHERVFQGILN